MHVILLHMFWGAGLRGLTRALATLLRRYPRAFSGQRQGWKTPRWVRV